MTGDVVRWLLLTAAAAVAASAAVAFLGRLLRSFLQDRPAIVALINRERWPARIAASAIAVRGTLEELPASAEVSGPIRHATTLGVIAALAWLAHRSLGVAEQALIGRFDIGVRDNRQARARRTQAQVLRRFASIVVTALAILFALSTFSWWRRFGTSVLAAGGLIGVVIGVAGRSTIGNLIAGLQIAFAEPIRLDDVVVVEGEWGHVEEIGLTYVVVRLWDERRLLLPTSYFVETPFQNWTKDGSEILGPVELWVDHAAPLDALRDQLLDCVERSPYWDGRTAVLQVTDTTAHAIKVRIVVSAATAGDAWNLRCEVREHLVGWLADHCPDGLPVLRAEGVAIGPTDRDQPAVDLARPARRSRRGSSPSSTSWTSRSTSAGE